MKQLIESFSVFQISLIIFIDDMFVIIFDGRDFMLLVFDFKLVLF